MTCAERPGGKETVLALVASGKLDLRTLLESPMTDRVQLADAPAAYPRIEAAHGDILKVLVKWP